MDYAAARKNMVECQVRTNKVIDQRVVDALSAVPREAFVRPDQAGFAYIDEDLPLGGGRVLMEPMVIARLMQAAALRAGERVLVVGAGSGYIAALAAKIGAVVTAQDVEGPTTPQARTAAAAYGFTLSVTADLAQPVAGPFDVILFAGAVADGLDAYGAALVEDGRMLAVVYDTAGVIGKATLFVRDGGVVSNRVLFDAACPVLPEFAARPKFVF